MRCVRGKRAVRERLNVCCLRTAAFSLSGAQQAALESLIGELDEDRPVSHLLFGVTGSGKTAVYMELIRECLRRGRSALLLAPEVALAMKLRRDAQLALPDAPLFFFHGYQPPTVREPGPFASWPRAAVRASWWGRDPRCSFRCLSWAQ